MTNHKIAEAAARYRLEMKRAATIDAVAWTEFSNAGQYGETFTALRAKAHEIKLAAATAWETAIDASGVDYFDFDPEKFGA
jgi:hypothetical protein